MEYVKYQRCDILLVVAFCGTVFALESANVVGYQNQSIGQFNITATPFLQVNGGEAWTLGDIKPNANWIEMSDTIQTFTAAGKADVAYMYITEATATEYGVTPGWYDLLDDQATTPMNHIPVAAGTGFLAASGANGATLTLPNPLAK